MLTGFTAGLLLITISELGDKTFFIAVLLAMRHPKYQVLTGVIAALATMTIISVLLGQAITLLPKTYVKYAEVLLLAIFGFYSLWQASRMSPQATCTDELSEAEEEVKHSQVQIKYGGTLGILLKSFLLTFLGEWGDRTQFATVTLAAGNNALGVTLGAILGHSICAVIAVTSGCFFADRISERNIAAIGGILFLVFAVVAWFN